MRNDDGFDARPDVSQVRLNPAEISRGLTTTRSDGRPFLSSMTTNAPVSRSTQRKSRRPTGVVYWRALLPSASCQIFSGRPQSMLPSFRQGNPLDALRGRTRRSPDWSLHRPPGVAIISVVATVYVRLELLETAVYAATEQRGLFSNQGVVVPVANVDGQPVARPAAPEFTGNAVLKAAAWVSPR